MVKMKPRLTVAVTQIVTNSTTENGTVKLLSCTKCKIISNGLEGILGSGGVSPLIKLEGKYS